MVIAYKELRKLEHMILGRLQELNHSLDREMFIHSHINIDHFYGIEIDDFASEVAILSLWIAKHQMNREFKELFSIDLPLIPLKETGRIVAANANRIDWQEVCPNNGVEEIYLIGNPPYVGSSMQSKEQKADYDAVFKGGKIPRKLDFIGLWFIQGAKYIRSSKAKLAFVSTNSITQGDQVAMLFPLLFEYNVEIGFAHSTFKWSNNAKYNAGVSVIVLNLRVKSSEPKYIFTDNIRTNVKNISPYLVDSGDIVVASRLTPCSREMPKMTYGCKPVDGGNLILSSQELANLKCQGFDTKRWIKKFMGADDYINNKERYCIWVTDEDAKEAMKSPLIAERAERVRDKRLESPDKNAVKMAETPWRFREQRIGNAIIFPAVSSELRDYIPIGFVGPEIVISNRAFAIYDAEPWLFTLLTSKIHMAWTQRVCGRLETRINYSNTIVYNNFPVPPLSEKAKTELNRLALRVLDVREYYCEYTLAQLYDPDEMPQLLREAHANIDAYVDSLYRTKPFESDEERLTVLFDMYEKAIAAETLELEQKKKTRRKKKHER